jgi:hypothetical protein
MKVNFNIFPGQHNHHILTSLNHSGQFWRVRVRNRFPLPASLEKLEYFLKGEWYKIPLETVQNLYESISGRTASVFKERGGPVPYQ